MPKIHKPRHKDIRIFDGTTYVVTYSYKNKAKITVVYPPQRKH